MTETQYSSLGGYDAIAAVSDNLLSRLKQDQQLARFWRHRGEDGARRMALDSFNVPARERA